MLLHGTPARLKQAIFYRHLRNSEDLPQKFCRGLFQIAAARWSRAALTGSIAAISTAASSSRARIVSVLLLETVTALLLSPEMCVVALFALVASVPGSWLLHMVAGA